MSYSAWKSACLLSLVLCFLALATGAVAQSQSNAVQQAPMAQVAQQYSWRAVRADIVPQVQGTKAGEPVPVHVVLLNANGQPTNATEDTPLIIQATGPSGKVETIKTQISAGTSWAEAKFPAGEPGLTKLTVTHPEKTVLGSSNFVLITPPQGTQAKTPLHKKKAAKKKPPTGRLYPPLMRPRLQNAAMVVYDFQPADQPAETGGTEIDGPRIMLQVSGERDSNVRADGTTFERVAVYYMDSQPPKSAIKVWLTWDHGEITPNPIIIKKGEYFAEAHWISGSPVKKATVSIAGIQPALPVQGAKAASINFVEAVTGVAFFNPPTTMSIVDQSDLHARFYDISGNFVRTSDKRSVTVSTSSPILKFDPNNQDTDWDFATNLTPTGWGTAKIEVATPGYPPFTHTLVITYVGVMLLCIAGGLLGSLGDILTNRETARGWRILARLMVGALAAIVACWAYVIVGLPQVPTGILHSRIAVLGVSLVGGWAGIIAVRKVGKMLGLEI